MPGARPILVALAWLLCAVLAWGTFLIARNHLREAESRNVMECGRNTRRIASAAAGFQEATGRLPRDARELIRTGKLDTDPICPSSRANTYLVVGADSLGASSEAYTIMCSGNRHHGLQIPAGYPQYGSIDDQVRYGPKK